MTVNYREVERTVEFDPIDGWVYRVVDTEYGVLYYFRSPKTDHYIVVIVTNAVVIGLNVACILYRLLVLP